MPGFIQHYTIINLGNLRGVQISLEAQMRFLVSSTVFWSLLALLLMLGLCVCMDSLNQSQSMSEGETLISARGKFQLGFFSTDNSSNRYLGIWFYNIPSKTIVWVANRNKPINGSLGLLKIEHGTLVIQDNSGRAYWSSNPRSLSSRSTTTKLLDSGNLVLKYDNSESYLWQSFDDPTDTMLAGMKLGWDFKDGMEWQLTSWKSAEDPFPGHFSYRMDPRGFPQLKLLEDKITRFRSHPRFGSTHTSFDSVITSIFVYGSQQAYFSYDLHDQNSLLRFLINCTGKLQHYKWNTQTLDWTLLIESPSDSCDEYAKCGPNAVCVIVNAVRICECLPGYVSKSAEGPDKLDPWYSGGCTTKSPFNCSGPEGFKRVKRVKLPDLVLFEMNTSMTLKECENMCLRNCTCTAYAHIFESRDKKGCGFWFGDLLDIRISYSEYEARELFVRVVASELEGNSKRWKGVVVAAAVILSISSTIFCLWASWRRRRGQGVRLDDHAGEEEKFELPMFGVAMISRATNNFSHFNKIGQGGFGPVYKLQNGQEIAVKRLSETSRQGLNEFKNEVVLIAKLQHRNLVKLLGCCIEGQERMLVYEYMPNGSLDSFVFTGTTGGSYLLWRTKFNIIIGVAKGLLYLHQDSRLTIIHRDLKASNVLLDSKMNPKISDFGMARTFGEDQFLEKTKRIVGTYGYMSPEYVVDGIFSIKSDVFSFGVLVLEIVCGKRNREFHHPDHNFNLLGHTWNLWVEGNAHELIHEWMEDSFPLSEVMRCIQVGLLCVQRCPEDRPTMSSVLLMLDSESMRLPQPKEPGFYLERIPNGKDFIMDGSEKTAKEITVTLLEGR
ncbi:G-type lectin S-receptor-like serine/threonine-protein kinase At4g27290 isoform X3 [Punica granatum]|uniref:Receptor-like serine/threonine-protein kinase n=1 Tax=Punica granatum TaxID=22663 RepID=A0A6P8D0V4_PUNGR|nr:G-type lectin S-receptor-like serine/threonine-protein kinase At4g27290 isoform X3 [Punica granatum]